MTTLSAPRLATFRAGSHLSTVRRIAGRAAYGVALLMASLLVVGGVIRLPSNGLAEARATARNRAVRIAAVLPRGIALAGGLDMTIEHSMLDNQMLRKIDWLLDPAALYDNNMADNRPKYLQPNLDFDPTATVDLRASERSSLLQTTSSRGGMMAPYREFFRSLAMLLIPLFIALSFAGFFFKNWVGGGGGGDLQQELYSVMMRTFVALILMSGHLEYHIAVSAIAESLTSHITNHVEPEAMGRGALRMADANSDGSNTAVYTEMAAIASRLQSNSASRDDSLSFARQIGLNGLANQTTCLTKASAAIIDHPDDTAAIMNGGCDNIASAGSTGSMLTNMLKTTLGWAGDSAMIFLSKAWLGTAMTVIWFLQGIYLWCMMLGVVIIKNLSLVFAPLAMAFFVWPVTASHTAGWFRSHTKILMLLPMLKLMIGMLTIIGPILFENMRGLGPVTSFMLFVAFCFVGWKGKQLADSYGTELYGMVSEVGMGALKVASTVTAAAVTGGISMGAGVGAGVMAGARQAGQVGAPATSLWGSAKNGMQALSSMKGTDTLKNGFKGAVGTARNTTVSDLAQRTTALGDVFRPDAAAQFAAVGYFANQSAEKRKAAAKVIADRPVAAAPAYDDIETSAPAESGRGMAGGSNQGGSTADASGPVNINASGTTSVAAQQLATDTRLSPKDMGIDGPDIHPKDRAAYETLAEEVANDPTLAGSFEYLGPASDQYGRPIRTGYELQAGPGAAAALAKVTTPRNADGSENMDYNERLHKALNATLRHSGGATLDPMKNPAAFTAAQAAGIGEDVMNVSPDELLKHGNIVAAITGGIVTRARVEKELPRRADVSHAAGTAPGSLSDTYVRHVPSALTANYGDPAERKERLQGMVAPDSMESLVRGWLSTNPAQGADWANLSPQEFKVRVNAVSSSASEAQKWQGLSEYVANAGATAGQVQTPAGQAIDMEVVIKENTHLGSDGQTYGLDAPSYIKAKGDMSKASYRYMPGSFLDTAVQRESAAAVSEGRAVRDMQAIMAELRSNIDQSLPRNKRGETPAARARKVDRFMFTV